MVRDATRVDARFARGNRLRDLRLKGGGRLSWRPLFVTAPFGVWSAARWQRNRPRLGGKPGPWGSFYMRRCRKQRRWTTRPACIRSGGISWFQESFGPQRRDGRHGGGAGAGDPAQWSSVRGYFFCGCVHNRRVSRGAAQAHLWADLHPRPASDSRHLLKD